MWSIELGLVMFKQIIIVAVIINLGFALIRHDPNENDHGSCEQANRETILQIQQDKDITARIIAVAVSLNCLIN